MKKEHERKIEKWKKRKREVGREKDRERVCV